MSKINVFQKVFRWLGDAGLKAFVVLALVIGGYYVYAEMIVWPANDPNPVSGVVGTFVGASDNAFTTSLNYADANKICSNSAGNLAGSHICTPDEMTNSYNHGTPGVSLIFSQTKQLWINNGPPGYLASSNDCGGWSFTGPGTDPSYPNYGSVWDFDKKYGFVTSCSPGLKFACCK